MGFDFAQPDDLAMPVDFAHSVDFAQPDDFANSDNFAESDIRVLDFRFRNVNLRSLIKNQNSKIASIHHL